MNELMHRVAMILFVLVLGCRANAPSPQSVPTTQAAPPDAPSAVDAAPPPVGLVITPDTPTHRQLGWLVEVLGQRKGVITASELAAHQDRVPPGSSDAMLAFYAGWGAETEGAVVEAIEVDDPTYIRAIVVAGDRRWRVVLTVDRDGRITFVDLKRAPRG
jgi:hypothetical protein